MTGVDIARYTGSTSAVEALGNLDITSLGNLDTERLSELRKLINAATTNLIVQRDLERDSPAAYAPPPGGGHPGINIVYPGQPPAVPTADARPERRTFTLAEVVRYASATGGITGAACSVLLIPLQPILGPHDSMLAPAVITTVFGFVMFVVTAVINHQDNKRHNR